VDCPHFANPCPLDWFKTSLSFGLPQAWQMRPEMSVFACHIGLAIHIAAIRQQLNTFGVEESHRIQLRFFKNFLALGVNGC
tara:strand:- start:636 stop:878 length:243 start_codon:yes stop_codon:yes gene_type:complete